MATTASPEQSGSELIATRDGDDTVNGGAGNDKLDWW